MRGVIYTVLLGVPLAVGLWRGRHWLGARFSGRSGVFWCAGVALCVAAIPALIVCGLLPDSWPPGRQHLAFVLLALPALAGALFLFRQGAAELHPASCAMPPTTPPTTDEVALPAPAGAEVAPGARAPGPAGRVEAEPVTAAVKGLAAAAAAPSGPKGAEPALRRSPIKVQQAEAGSTAAAAAAVSVMPAPVNSPSVALPQATEPAPGAGASLATAPTTVTECLLTMSISCEEYLLANFVRMAEAPLGQTEREMLRRLVEETDDKLARLRAARYRHHGEEVVRVVWEELPEVDLPVVPPGASVEQVRAQALKQTQVMVDFYRTVAAYVQRPSLKSLLVTLALDGQRHLAVIEQSAG